MKRFFTILSMAFFASCTTLNTPPIKNTKKFEAVEGEKTGFLAMDLTIQEKIQPNNRDWTFYFHLINTDESKKEESLIFSRRRKHLDQLPLVFPIPEGKYYLKSVRIGFDEVTNIEGDHYDEYFGWRSGIR